MTDLTLEFFNHVYCRVHSDNEGVLQELSEYFTFEVPGAQFSPKFRKYRKKDGRITGSWDGKIRLFDKRKKTIYAGLRQEIEDWAEESGYEIELRGSWRDRVEYDETVYKVFEQHLQDLSHITPRDYQIKATWKAVDNERCVLLSATGSGKSLIIYYLFQLLPKPALLIVPNIGLVEQMEADFQDYGWKDPIHKIYAGQEKINNGVVISTWQSIFEQPSEWFESFKTVIVDEVHHAKAKSIKDIMEMLPHVRYRIGLTGSLDDTQINSLVIKGLFGPIIDVARSRDLIDQGYLADLRIKTLLLKYPKEITCKFRGVSYPKETEWICYNPRRNRLIKDLCRSLEGNTLVLYRYVEKHGEPLYDLLRNGIDDKPVYYVSGKVGKEDREYIRTIVNQEDQSIIVASEGTFSEGVNIPNLDNLIFASPSKSRIQTMQKIGRGLRRTKNKTVCNLYDIADDLSPSVKKLNFALKHYLTRVKYYTEERFEFKQTRIELYNLYPEEDIE